MQSKSEVIAAHAIYEYVSGAVRHNVAIRQKISDWLLFIKKTDIKDRKAIQY